MSAEGEVIYKIAVWSSDPSMLALAADLAREAKYATCPLDGLPDLALFLRDSPTDAAGGILDLRSSTGLSKNLAAVAHEILELKAENKATPFLVILSEASTSQFFGDSTTWPMGLSLVTVPPSIDLSGMIAGAFKVFIDRASQIEERLDLEKGFIEEASSLIEETEPLILELEQNPNNADALNTIFRNIHTIKGSSGFFDQNPIPEFLHRFEDLLAKMKSGKAPVTQASVTVMLKGLDVTRQMLTSLRDHSVWSGVVAEAVMMFNLQGDGLAVEPVSKTIDDHKVEAKLESKLEAKIESKTREIIQVPVQMLDEFMELSGEITVIRNMVNKLVRVIEKETPGNRNVSLLGELLDEMHKINSSVQGRLTELRKVPAGRILKALPRAIRDLSKSLDKQIELSLSGEDLRLDTAVAQVLGESLVHLVRNAVDHGIESQVARTASGKNPVGRLEVSLHEEGDEIFAVIRDDGGGIDAAKVRKKLLSEAKFPEAEIMAFNENRLFATIFEPGFSTAAKITGISGRGVGLDMVKSSVDKLRGRIEIDSKLKIGTTFTLRLPIPKSVLIVSSLLVQAEGKAFAIPQDKIVRLIRVADAHAQQMIRTIEGGVALDFHGDLIPVMDLGTVLALRGKMPELTADADLASFVVIQTDAGIFACLVDAILDSEEIVMKKVGPQLEGRKAFSGATFMGDGTVGLILNVDGIAELSRVNLNYANHRKPSRPIETLRKQDILLVDIDVPGDFGVPMDSVSRLEDFDANQVQKSIDRSIVVYRDQAMPLVDLSSLLKVDLQSTFTMKPIDMTNRERAFVLVFKTKAGYFFGCVVDQIKDFISIEEDLRTTNRSYESIKGSVILENSVISVLDPEFLIAFGTKAFDQLESKVNPYPEPSFLKDNSAA